MPLLASQKEGKRTEKTHGWTGCHNVTKMLRQQQQMLLYMAVPAALLALVVPYFMIVRQREKRTFKVSPKGSFGYWLVGEMFSFLMSPPAFFADRAEKYGSKNFTSHLMPNPVVVVGEIADRDFVLSTEAKGKSAQSHPDHWRNMFGSHSVSNSLGENHNRLRKLFAPFLTPEAMKRYVNAVDRVTLEWLDERAAYGKFIDCTEFKNLALNILFETIFGGNATK